MIKKKFIVYHYKMDPWGNLPLDVICQIFGQITDVEDINNAINASHRFREYGGQCVRYITHPTPIGISISLVKDFVYLQRMINVTATVSTMKDVEIIRPMYLLEEANFTIDHDKLDLIEHLIDSYLTPVNVTGGLGGPKIRQRELKNFTLRFIIVDGSKLINTIIIIDRLRLYMPRLHTIGPPYMEVIDRINKKLPAAEPIARLTGPYLIIPPPNNLYGFMLEADLGPIDPSRPPGPSNPSLKDNVNFFHQKYMLETNMLHQLLLIYLMKNRLLQPGTDAYMPDSLMTKWLGQWLNRWYGGQAVIQFLDFLLDEFIKDSRSPDYDFLSVYIPIDSERSSDRRMVRDTFEKWRDLFQASSPTYSP